LINEEGMLTGFFDSAIEPVEKENYCATVNALLVMGLPVHQGMINHPKVITKSAISSQFQLTLL